MPTSPRVLLVQLPIPPAGPEPVRGNVPLAGGYLKLMARRAGLERHFDIELFPTALVNTAGDEALVAAIVARAPDLLGFTCYLWNVVRTLWIAARVKERLPRTRVILGGPEITADNDWVLADPAVDFAAFGEGEQTFVDWLGWIHSGEDAEAVRRIAGLGFREGGVIRPAAPRKPMNDLSAIASPWREGILDVGEHDQLLLETVRGCVFRCKFCYYPKAYDSQYFVAAEFVRADLEHARAHGVREVFLLDPTLNQRPAFGEFVDMLASCNPDRSLEFHGELRGEGITPRLAERMKAANFVEVEVGLQSVDPRTQETMDRRNNLRAFEAGVRALREVGIRVKTDLIVGLPGDTAASVRAGYTFLDERGLCDIAQVFRLSILPGTAFREEAAQLGLQFQGRPPYSVLATATLDKAAIDDLLAEAEVVFDCTFDPLPEPWLESAVTAPGLQSRWDVDLDAVELGSVPDATTFVFELRLRGRDLFAARERIDAAIRGFLARHPFTTLLVVLETAIEFPLDVIEVVRAACSAGPLVYLDRHHESHTGVGGAARRIVVLLPADQCEMIDTDWLAALEGEAEVLWAAPQTVPPTED